MFSNLKWSGVFSSSWTSTAVWCQQNWAEACGLWARCCCGVTTPSWLWMGCAGQTTVQTCWLFGPRIETLPQMEVSAPLPRATLYVVLRFVSRMETDHDKRRNGQERLLPTWPDSLHHRRRKRKSKLHSWTEKQAAAGKQKKKLTVLPHVPLACDRLRQLLIVYIPGKKMPRSISSQSLLQVIAKV